MSQVPGGDHRSGLEMANMGRGANGSNVTGNGQFLGLNNQSQDDDRFDKTGAPVNYDMVPEMGGDEDDGVLSEGEAAPDKSIELL